MNRIAHLSNTLSALLIVLALGHATLPAATLIQYWPLDDGGGAASATNAISGGNPATLANVDPGTAWISGDSPAALSYSTAAISLDGTDDYLNGGNVGLKENGAFSFWIKPFGFSGDVRLLSQVTAVNPARGTLRFDAFGTGKLQIYGESSWVNLVDMEAVPVGQWTHLVVTYSHRMAQLWVNGIRQLPSANSSLDFDAAPLGISAPGDAEGTQGGPYGLPFYGMIDDISIWDGPLTSNSIVQLANGVRPTAITDVHVPEPAQLVHYWPLEENTGAVEASSGVPEGNVGALINFDADAAWTTGDVAAALASRSSVALAFDGADDYIDIGNLGLSSVGTLSMWIKPTTVTSPDGMGIRLLGQLTAMPGAGLPAIDVHVAGPFGSGSIQVSDDGNWRALAPDNALETDVWHHLAFVYKPDEVTLFIDGTPQLTGKSRMNFDTADMTLGAPWILVWGNYFSGLMDDVSVWDNALSYQSIQALASGASPLTLVDTTNKEPSEISLTVQVETPAVAQLVQYFPLEETSGDVAPNAIPGGNTAYLSNYVAGLNPWVTTDLPPALTNNPSCLVMNGSVNYATLGNIDQVGAGTITMWVKPTSVEGDIRFYSHENGSVESGGDAGFYGVGGIRVWNGQSWSNLAPEGTVSAGQWTHLAFVYDTGGVVTLYINGGLVGSGSSGFQYADGRIGLGAKGQLTYGNTFGGLMDDVAIWDGPLSAAEIEGLAEGVSPMVLETMANLVQYFPLNGSGESLEVANIITGGVTGTLKNYSASVTSWVTNNLPPSLPGTTTALNFDGVDDFLNLGNLGLKGAGSVSMWLYPATLEGDRRLFSYLSGPTAQGGAVGFRENGEVWTFTGNDAPQIGLPGTLNSGQWYHLAFVYGFGNATLYVNGEAQRTVSCGFDYDAADFGLGAKLINAYGDSVMGLIDDVSIWDGPLAPSMVATLAAGVNPQAIGQDFKNLVITWPAYPVGFTLEAAQDLSSNDWQAVSPGYQQLIGVKWVATLPMDGASKFFRLRRTQSE